jgi:uncharacterized membrane protein
MTLFASLFPIACWLLYNLGVPFVERRTPSLSTIMTMQRRRWVANAARRESPLDAILSGNLMQSVSLLASTSMLIVLALIAGFGAVPQLMDALNSLGLGHEATQASMQIQLVVLLTIFASSFFAFTLSLRQFNHFCIMIGSISHDEAISEEEIEAITMLNALAAKNFNNGIRAYYFAVPAITWFVSPLIAIGVTALTAAFIVHREFFSSAHRISASVAVIASRREKRGKGEARPAAERRGEEL